ncbi:YfbM family protein [Solimonas marina]
MCLVLQTLSDANISKVLQDPPLIWKVVAPDDSGAYERARKGEALGFLGRLLGKANTKKAPILELSLDEGEVAETDLDKAWHGIHFLLTQTAWEGEAPLNFLLAGGAEAGDIDLGHGTGRALLSNEVAAIASALEAINESTLRERFSPDQMMRLEIYPEIWDRPLDEDDSLAYCLEYFEVLRSFVSDAALRNVGIIIYVT